MRRGRLSKDARHWHFLPSVEVGFSPQGCVGEVLVHLGFPAVYFDVLDAIPDDLVDFWPCLGGAGLRALLVPHEDLEEVVEILPSARPAVASVAARAVHRDAGIAGSCSFCDLDNHVSDFGPGAFRYIAPSIDFSRGVCGLLL